MKVPRMFLMLACASILGATIATGITMAVSAGASGTNTTYYGCVSAKGAASRSGTRPDVPRQVDPDFVEPGGSSGADRSTGASW